ncbi:hypothetical protein FHS27_003354 [Rhodopirellula rubra]|uniref:Uncharacterized protein n=1 Tax=Aporhodopirellula rubra TaxID=980271 RepID=A0A7W5E0F7_9BACT|nr:hypothetical protein [Aporhodopirellula rubra]MBB3207529.1 hypothetical protein [Aporhodopirellula rubra]
MSRTSIPSWPWLVWKESMQLMLVAPYSEPPVDVDGNRLRYNGDYEVVFSPISKE